MSGISNGWNRKATHDEPAASSAVGGFSPVGATDYHAGLRVLEDRHISVGSKTISDVVEIGKRSLAAAHVAHSRSGSASGDHGAASAWVGFAIVVIGVAWLVRAGSKGSAQSRALATAQVHRVNEDAASRELVPIVTTGVIAKPAECFYLASSGAEVIGEHHHAQYVGRYQGMSMRVARGLYVRSGSSRGRRIDSVTSEVDDRGTLYISNRRLLFIGGRKTIDVPFSKIASVVPFSDAVQVNRSNAPAVLVRTGTQEAAIILQRALTGDLKSVDQKRADARVQLLEMTPRADAALALAKKEHEEGKMNDEEFRQASERVEKIKEQTQTLLSKSEPGEAGPAQ